MSGSERDRTAPDPPGKPDEREASGSPANTDVGEPHALRDDQTLLDPVPAFQGPDFTVDEATIASDKHDTAKDPVAITERTAPALSDETIDEAERAPAPPLTPTLPPVGEKAHLTRTEPPAEAAQEESPASAPVVPPKKRRSAWRFVLWFFGILFLGVAIAGVVLAIFWEPIVSAVIVAQAKRHGVALSFSAFELHRDRLILTDARIHADELPTVDVDAKSITIALDSSLNPTSAAASNTHITLTDAPGIAITAGEANTAIVDFAPTKIELDHVGVEAATVADLLGFAKVGLTPPLVSVAPIVTDVHVGVKAISTAWPTPLAIDASDVAMLAGKATLHHLTTTIPIVNVPVDLDEVTVNRDAAGFAVVIPDAPFLDLGIDAKASSLHVVLRKVSADLLASKLHWSRPPGFALSATADVNLPSGKAGDPTGTFNATLDHYVPPHPPELDGIVFGTATKARGAFTLRGEVAIVSDLHVDAGDLHMTGTGTATAKDRGSIGLTLDGSIPCNELAVSAIAAHLGFAAAMITGELTADHLTGTVEVKLGVEIEGKDASHPAIHPSAFLHCSIAL